MSAPALIRALKASASLASHSLRAVLSNQAAIARAAPAPPIPAKTVTKICQMVIMQSRFSERMRPANFAGPLAVGLDILLRPPEWPRHCAGNRKIPACEEWTCQGNMDLHRRPGPLRQLREKTPSDAPTDRRPT